MRTSGQRRDGSLDHKVGDVVVPRQDRTGCKTHKPAEWWCGDFRHNPLAFGVIRCVHRYKTFRLYGCAWYKFSLGSGHRCERNAASNAWSLCDGCLELATPAQENEMIRLVLAGDFMVELELVGRRDNPGKIAGEDEIA